MPEPETGAGSGCFVGYALGLSGLQVTCTGYSVEVLPSKPAQQVS